MKLTIDIFLKLLHIFLGIIIIYIYNFVYFSTNLYKLFLYFCILSCMIYLKCDCFNVILTKLNVYIRCKYIKYQSIIITYYAYTVVLYLLT